MFKKQPEICQEVFITYRNAKYMTEKAQVVVVIFLYDFRNVKNY